MENALIKIKQRLAMEVAIYEYLTIRVPDFFTEFKHTPLSKMWSFLTSSSSIRFYGSFCMSIKLLCFLERDREWMASASSELLAMLLALEGDVVEIKRLSAWISILAAYKNISISADTVEAELLKGPAHVSNYMKELQSRTILLATS